MQHFSILAQGRAFAIRGKTSEIMLNKGRWQIFKDMTQKTHVGKYTFHGKNHFLFLNVWDLYRTALRFFHSYVLGENKAPLPTSTKRDKTLSFLSSLFFLFNSYIMRNHQWHLKNIKTLWTKADKENRHV